MEDDVLEPQEEDYIIYDTGPLGSMCGVGVYGGKQLGTFLSAESAEAFIKETMETDDYYPNTWRMDDHGGYMLVTA